MGIHVGDSILLKSLTTMFLTVNGGSCVSPSLDLDKQDWRIPSRLGSMFIHGFCSVSTVFHFPKEIFSLSLASLLKLNA